MGSSVMKHSKVHRELAVKLLKLRNLNKKFNIHPMTRGAAITRAFKSVSPSLSYEDLTSAERLIDTAAFAKVDLPTLFKFLDNKYIRNETRKRIAYAIAHFHELVEMEQIKAAMDWHPPRNSSLDVIVDEH